MNIYSAAEIEDQVFAHEGVKIKINDPTAKFSMQYAEFFKERMDDDATVNELKLRITTFLNTQRII